MPSSSSTSGPAWCAGLVCRSFWRSRNSTSRHAGSKKDAGDRCYQLATNRVAARNCRKFERLVEKTLSEKNLTLSVAPVGLIGLDTGAQSVGGGFELEGYPTLVILDQKGIVQSVHVGYDPSSGTPLNRSLTKEIETLLGGKPLVRTNDGAQGASRKTRGIVS